MLVAAQYQGLAQALAAGLDPVAGVNMFATPAHDASTNVLRYFISSGLIGDQFAAAIDSPAALYAACLAAKASVTLATCTALLSASVVSNGWLATQVQGQTILTEEGPHGLLARLGLKLGSGTI